MGNQFFPAPDVEAIGRELIREHHVHLLEHNARVEFCFCSDIPKKNGNEIWGTAQKISGKQAFMFQFKEAKFEANGEYSFDLTRLNQEFFLITISEPVWDKLKRHPEKRRALVDHELMHCQSEIDHESGDVKFSILGHDFEGFKDEISRYGLWRDNAAEMAAVMKDAQGSLDFSGAMNAVRDMDAMLKNEGATMTVIAGDKTATLGKRRGGSATAPPVH